MATTAAETTLAETGKTDADDDDEEEEEEDDDDEEDEAGETLEQPVKGKN